MDFYCHEFKLAIEIDGSIHKKQEDYDELRQLLIENEGISFIRVSNNEVENSLDILIEKINIYT